MYVGGRSGCFAGLQNTTKQWPWCAIWRATLESLSFLAACKTLERNLSRPKRGSLGAPGSRRSVLVRAPGAASGKQSGARLTRALSDHWVMSGGTRPSPTGLFATSRHGNFTSSSKLPEPCHLPFRTRRDFLSSSTKLSAALSRIAIDNSAARNLRNAVTDRLTPYSQRGVQF